MTEDFSVKMTSLHQFNILDLFPCLSITSYNQMKGVFKLLLGGLNKSKIVQFTAFPLMLPSQDSISKPYRNP